MNAWEAAVAPRNTAPAAPVARRHRARGAFDARVQASILDGPVAHLPLHAWSGDCGRPKCGTLYPHAHRDHALDLIGSRPTLGAIRESQKHNAKVHERSRRSRELLPAEQREPAPLNPAGVRARPYDICRWCNRLQPIEADALCQDCTHVRDRQRARAYTELRTGVRAEAITHERMALAAANRAILARLRADARAAVELQTEAEQARDAAAAAEATELAEAAVLAIAQFLERLELVA